MSAKANCLLFAVLLCETLCYSQQCANCNVKPRVDLYDLDIQVQQPQIQNNDSTAYFQFQALAYFFTFFDVIKYFEEQNACVNIFIGRDGEEVNLPAGRIPAFLPSKSAQYGYLLTGHVKASANKDLVLHLEVKAACPREIVAEADVLFQPSSDEVYLKGIVRQALAQLMPIGGKIKQFELTQRENNKDYSLRGDTYQEITLTPAKTNLRNGETTEISLELKDCDGWPLAGREISFDSKAMWYGGTLPATTGGIVSPSKVTTDAQGKAKVSFKMNAGAGRPAIVNAHSDTRSYVNCNDAFRGSVKIDALPAYKVMILYDKTASQDLNANINESGIVMKGGDKIREYAAYQTLLMYYPATNPKDGEQIMMMPEFESAPGYQNSKKGKTIVVHNQGTSSYDIISAPLELIGAPSTKSATTEQHYLSSSPQPPSVSFIIKNNELIFFSGGVEFPEVENKISPPSSSFGIEQGNKKYFPLKAKMITDPKSPYKWLYEFEYNNEESYAREGQVFSAGKKEVVWAMVKIWKSF